MFTRMKKYHKAFLIFVTVIIAASFGMGTVCMRLADKEDLQVVATFSQNNVTGYQFREAKKHWPALFQLAESISPRAKLLVSKDGFEDSTAIYGFMCARRPEMLDIPYFPQRMREMLSPRLPAYQIWDAIYSLREEVAKVERRFLTKLESPDVRDKLLQGQADVVDEEIRFYQTLGEEERKKLRTTRLEVIDAWNMIMLHRQAQEWGVQVTEAEIDALIAKTKKAYVTPQAMDEAMKAVGIYAQEFRNALRKVLMILKYLEVNNQPKISMKSVYENYKKFHTRYAIQWVQFDHSLWKAADEKAYLESRLAFYDRKLKESPNYFQMPATADFEYVFVKNEQFLDKVKPSEAEIESEWKKEQENKKNLDPNAQEEGEASQRKAVVERIKATRALNIAKSMISEVYERVLPYASNIDFEVIAGQNGFIAEKHTGISEEEFLSSQTERTNFAATSEAKTYIYQKLQVGGISPILTYKGEGHFFLRLLKKTPARLIQREEIEKDDSLFLQRYYFHNKQELQGGKRYRVGYVIADASNIEKEMLVTTRRMFEFYEKYKDQLYKVEPVEEKSMSPAKDAKDGKDAKEIVKAVSYKPFEEVKDDLEKRVTNYIKSNEIRKIHIVHEICKEKGKDANIGVIVKELAREIMLSPESMKYVETQGFSTPAEMKWNNPVQNPDLAIAVPEDASGLSKIEDSKIGKYFYKILETQESKENKFSDLRGEIKEHFLKGDAMEKARRAAEMFGRKYYQATQIEQKDKVRFFQILANLENLKLSQNQDFEKASEIDALKTATGLDTILQGSKSGDVTSPVSDRDKGVVILAQITEKKAPEASMVSEKDRSYIHNLLWEMESRKLRANFLDHESLSKKMGLVKKTDLAYGEDSDDYRED